MALHISILGNIGAGKSTLASLIHRELPHIRYLQEPNVKQDPYLELFGATPKAFALQHQLWFLVTGLELVSQRSDHSGDTVQDSSILACPIFAEAMAKFGSMEMRDFHLFETLCQKVIEHTPPPTLYIIVRASIKTLLERIRIRGRASEIAMSSDYLHRLQELHDSKLVDYWLPRRGARTMFIDTDITDLHDTLAAKQVISSLRLS